jgi:hypothetical protein
MPDQVRHNGLTDFMEGLQPSIPLFQYSNISGKTYAKIEPFLNISCGQYLPPWSDVCPRVLQDEDGYAFPEREGGDGKKVRAYRSLSFYGGKLYEAFNSGRSSHPFSRLSFFTGALSIRFHYKTAYEEIGRMKEWE